MRSAVVVGVARDDRHRFGKVPARRIFLREGFGVDGDAHAGATVRHRSRVAADPSRPNLRQVHLLPVEFLRHVRGHGYGVEPADLGENVLTEGLDVLSLPRDAVLLLGPQAAVRVTGLRNPCWQIDSFRKGLLKLSVGRDAEGNVVRKTGIMAVVTASGAVAPGDPIEVRLPPQPHQPLAVV